METLQRITAIAIIILASQALNWLICGAAPDWIFAIHGQEVQGASHNPLKLWPVLFANCGGIVILPWLLYTRKDLPLTLTCGVFIVFTLLTFLNTSIYNENRDWLEIAPIAWVLIAQLAPAMNKPQEAINKKPAPGIMAQV